MDKPACILLVDDDAVDRRICRRAIQRHADVEPEFSEAETGEEALAVLASKAFDCVLLDLRLPDFNGLEMLARLQDEAGEVSAPVVMLTGAEDVAVAVEAMRRGARDYLVKDTAARYQVVIPAVVERARRDQEMRQARRRAEEELRAAEAKYRTLIEQLPAICYIANLQGPGRLLFVSPQARWLGIEPEQWIADQEWFWRRLHPEDLADVRAAWEASRGAPGIPFHCEYRFRTPDGREVWLRDQATLVDSDAPESCRMQGILFDITESKRVETELKRYQSDLERLVTERTLQLRQANRRLKKDIRRRRSAEQNLFAEKQRAEVTLRSIVDAVITTDAQGRVEYLNATAERLTGWAAEDARNKPLGDVFSLFVHESGQDNAIDPMLLMGSPTAAQTDYRLRRRDGGVLHITLSPAEIRGLDGEVAGSVVVAHDVTQQRRLTEQLSHQARHDALTGLANRSEFERRLAQALDSARNHGAGHVLWFIDLDGFKFVNDNGGHAAGDEMLRQLASLLAADLRTRDTVARLGGDEFACLLEHCDVEQGMALADQLREVVRRFNLFWGGKAYNVRASIGVVPLTPTSCHMADLLKAADSACYAAKAAGGDCVRLYRYGAVPQPSPVTDVTLARIKGALKRECFELLQQPCARLSGGGETDHFELLLQLRDTDGALPAASFLPLAARHRLTPEIDRWVIRHTIRCLASSGAEDRYFINLAPESISDEGLIEFIRRELERHGSQPHRLGFEVSEPTVLNHFTATARFARAIRTLGCGFTLDDFTNVLPTVEALRELKPDYLKLSGELVRGIETDHIARAVLDATNRLSHALSVATVAKWPETPAALSLLRELSFDYAQGRILGAPVPWGCQAA